MAALMASTILNFSEAWNKGNACSNICNAVGNPSLSPSLWQQVTSRSEPCIANPLHRLPKG
eukprot:CAMPEP_0176321616 /NCGR_PEP_ID=MMETSP0121_2-20121125/71445_1 /TAXON_ID=160619 /ORGANISM="Kryptoperidinium foliaceum, Strain CCMP 1326" /LENGTH=60 /DNA_ID=CAMNT_0017664073 /DNA_START=11 /DNA_END=189 /DNA_ORIENTATION=-